MAGPRRALTLRSKGQILTLTLENLYSSGVGLHVNTTAHFCRSVLFRGVEIFLAFTMFILTLSRCVCKVYAGRANMEFKLVFVSVCA